MKKYNDIRHRFFFPELGVRGFIVQLDDSWKTIRSKKEYPENVSRILGQAMAVTALLANTIKLDGSLILQCQGKGLMSTLVAQANHHNDLRGLAQYADVEGHEDISTLLGAGRLVMTIDAVDKERYQGIVSLEGNQLSEMVENYFTQSEQLPTAIWLSCNERTASGLMLQVLPSETPDLSAWQHLLALTNTITDGEMLELDIQEILNRLYHDEELQLYDSETMQFSCQCSSEKIEMALLNLGLEEVESILKAEGIVNADCDFCNQNYRYDPVDIATLFKSTHSTPDKVQ